MSGFDSTRIYDEAKACDNQFGITIAEIQHGESAMQEFQQRFWAWATNTGVFAEPFLSLDVRLSGHEQPVTMIVSLLKLLKVNLEAVLRLDLAFCHNSVQVEQKEPQIPSTSTDGKAKHLTPSNMVKHLEGPFYGVDGCIQRLFRIANHISQSSQKSLQRRVDSFAQRNEIDFAGFENLIGTIVKFKFPRMQTSFQAQLVRSAVYRRQRILYQRHRKKRRDEYLVPRQTGPGLYEDGVPRYDRKVEAQSSSFPSQWTQTHRPAPSESLRPSTFDGDLFKKEIQKKPESQSDVESTISAYTGEIEYPRAPGLSEALDGAPELLECPYCLRLFPSIDYDNEHWWRDHVNQDLKPYICISEHCASAQPPIGFAKSRRWREHMEKAHGTDWDQRIHMDLSCETERPAKTCPLCDTVVGLFPTTYTGYSRNSADLDMSTKPLGKAGRVRFSDDKNLDTEINLPPDTGRHMKPAEYDVIDPDKMKLTKHIAHHLLSWCFLSLRTGIDEPDLQIEANDSNGSVISKRLDQGNSGIDSIMGRVSLNFEETRPFDLELAEGDESSSSHSNRNEWGHCLEDQPYDAEKDRIIQHFARRRSRPALREATLEKLRRRSQSLNKAFRRAEITGRDDWDSTKYRWTPLSSINNILQNDSSLLKALEEESDGVKSFVLLKAKRLISVLFRRRCLHWLQLFYNEDFSDEHFPINLIKPATSTSRAPPIWTIQSCNAKKTVSLWHTEDKDDIDYPDDQRDKMEDFCSIFQWQYFVPVFSPQDPVHILDPACQMPYLNKLGSEQTISSIVRHFVIHREHLNFEGDGQIGSVVDEQGNPHIAVKEILSAQGLSRETFHKPVENQLTTLAPLKDQVHPHLVRVIAIYTRGNRQYFVSPWARRGNLRDFWAKHPTLNDASPNISPQDWDRYLKWFFEQLLGLSSAIESLHYPEQSPEQAHRHGDLKSENILCFSDTDIGQEMIPTGVRLVVADAGHAGFHEETINFPKIFPTKFPTKLTGREPIERTKMYSPPEAEARTQGPMTRRYDIWSLGCIYLEFSIWMLYGSVALKSFHEDIGRGQPLYSEDPEVGLKDSVKTWIKAIKEDPRCTPIGQTAMGRLVSLIENRLLLVKTGFHRRDFHQDSGSTQEDMGSPPISTDDSFKISVRQPFFAPKHIQRADSKEVYKELKSIFDAAREPEASLAWINQDAMAEAAEWGPSLR